MRKSQSSKIGSGTTVPVSLFLLKTKTNIDAHDITCFIGEACWSPGDHTSTTAGTPKMFSTEIRSRVPSQDRTRELFKRRSVTPELSRPEIHPRKGQRKRGPIRRTSTTPVLSRKTKNIVGTSEVIADNQQNNALHTPATNPLSTSTLTDDRRPSTSPSRTIAQSPFTAMAFRLKHRTIRDFCSRRNARHRTAGAGARNKTENIAYSENMGGTAEGSEIDTLTVPQNEDHPRPRRPPARVLFSLSPDAPLPPLSQPARPPSPKSYVFWREDSPLEDSPTRERRAKEKEIRDREFEIEMKKQKELEEWMERKKNWMDCPECMFSGDREEPLVCVFLWLICLRLSKS